MLSDLTCSVSLFLLLPVAVKLFPKKMILHVQCWCVVWSIQGWRSIAIPIHFNIWPFGLKASYHWIRYGYGT